MPSDNISSTRGTYKLTGIWDYWHKMNIALTLRKCRLSSLISTTLNSLETKKVLSTSELSERYPYSMSCPHLTMSRFTRVRLPSSRVLFNKEVQCRFPKVSHSSLQYSIVPRLYLDRIKEFPLKEDKVLRKHSSIANGGSTWKRRYESRNKILALMMIWCTFQHVFPFKSLLGYLL